MTFLFEIHLREHDIQNEILRTFGTRPDMRIWRTNTGGAKINGRFVSFGLAGQADLHGILPGGKFLAVEVKSDAGRQSDQQINYQRMIERFGGVYVLARSVDDVMIAISRYLHVDA